MIVGGNMIVHITNDQGRKGDCKYIGNKCKNFLVTCSLLFLYTIINLSLCIIQQCNFQIILIIFHYRTVFCRWTHHSTHFSTIWKYFSMLVEYVSWKDSSEIQTLNFQPWIGAISARPTSAIVLLNWSCSIFSSNLFLRICARTANAPHMPSEIINNIAENTCK